MKSLGMLNCELLTLCSEYRYVLNSEFPLTKKTEKKLASINLKCRKLENKIMRFKA